MSDIVQQLEALLRPWRAENAVELERDVSERLARYEREEAAGLPTRTGRPARVIVAAGGIVWRPMSSDRRLAIIHRPRYDDWCLPKGKMDPGETISATARREVWEETGCEVKLRAFAGIIHYVVKAGPKFVFYWDMEAVSVAPLEPSAEVDQVQWLTVPEATQQLTYHIEREFLTRVV